MIKNDDLSDLGPDKVVAVEMLRSELAQLEMLLEKVRKHAGRSVWWAQFLPLIEALGHRFNQVPKARPEELSPAHWLNFFTAPSGRVEEP